MLNNIEAERSRKLLTKANLSDKLGITQNTYNRYIHGDSIPSAILIKMSELFECSIDYLLGRTPNR